jgi:anti-sigma factor RsiW
MSDCANVEVRELLPEFAHGRLAALERARVAAHLSACEECTAELATLEAVRRVYSRSPAVDTAAIVRALPRPASRVRAARRPLAWQIAAAVSFISLGGISLAVARSFFDRGGPVSAPAVAAPGRGVPVVGDSQNRGQTASVDRSSRPAISFGGGVDDLASEDVEKLLGALESLEAAPPVEPDVVPANEAGRARSDTSGGVL